MFFFGEGWSWGSVAVQGVSGWLGHQHGYDSSWSGGGGQEGCCQGGLGRVVGGGEGGCVWFVIGGLGLCVWGGAGGLFTGNGCEGSGRGPLWGLGWLDHDYG